MQFWKNNEVDNYFIYENGINTNKNYNQTDLYESKLFEQNFIYLFEKITVWKRFETVHTIHDITKIEQWLCANESVK